MSRDELMKILNLARWAPSGDNTQPWKFEIVSDDHVAIHGFDTRDHVLYDFNGWPSQIAHGALLETIRIAATAFGLHSGWILRPGCLETAPIYDVNFRHVPRLEPDSLFPYIKQRVVQRRSMQLTPLNESQRQTLRNAVGPNYTLQFIEGFSGRWHVAQLLWENANIRLTCPEAFDVHRQIIEWGARFSKCRIPEQAIGVDPLTARLMKWVMQDWKRVEFFNRYLFGTVLPRIQLDFMPAMRCAAHILLVPQVGPNHLIDYVSAGVAMQRLWLTVTSMGLCLQPQMTPVIFRWYTQHGRDISASSRIGLQAKKLAESFEHFAGRNPSDPIVFFCRVGYSKYPLSRSLRKDLGELLISGKNNFKGGNY